MGVLAADTITGWRLRSDMGGKLIGARRIFAGPEAPRIGTQRQGVSDREAISD